MNVTTIACKHRPVSASLLLGLATALSLSAASSVRAQDAPVRPYLSLIDIQRLSLSSDEDYRLDESLTQDPVQPAPSPQNPSGQQDDPDKTKKQRPRWTAGLIRAAGGFFSAGGYFISDSTGKAALGDAKFAGGSNFFVRPRHLGRLDLTGGLQLFSARDHFLPFTGGSQFDLIGPAFRLSTPRMIRRPQFSFVGGLYAGRLRSERLHFDRTNFTPGASLGVDFPINRIITLYAGYRVSQKIHGVDTDGASIGFRLF